MSRIAKFSVGPPSLWAATANPPPELPTLEEDIETDVVIIGGGYTGLSSAHHLSKAGIGCVIIEGNEAGWGASGRNGGMAVLRYKKAYSTLAAELGDEMATQLYRLIHEALDTMEGIVKEYRIDCDFKRSGHITAIESHSAIATLEADTRWLEKAIGDRVPRMLGTEEVYAAVGSRMYLGGFLDPRSAEVHPLNYARGFAAGLGRKGVPIYARSMVTGMRLDASGITAETAGGRVRAKRAIVATNAYTDLAPLGTDLHQRIIPVASSIIVTTPLRPDVAATILPGRQLITNTRRMVNYFRLLPDNRILFGGRGNLKGLEEPETYQNLQKLLAEVFPALAGVDIAFRWSGQVAMTPDDFPHMGRVGERIFYAMGYGGRGVALSNLLGKLLARMVQGDDVAAGPMISNRFAAIPFHAFRIPALQLIASYYKLRDRLAH